jgi:hypothetical protein
MDRVLVQVKPHVKYVQMKRTVGTRHRKSPLKKLHHYGQISTPITYGITIANSMGLSKDIRGKKSATMVPTNTHSQKRTAIIIFIVPAS